ncbi:MAG: hypothetical protein AB8G95_04335 [Anaerolineae bacterium]
MFRNSFLRKLIDGHSMAFFYCGVLLLLVGCGGNQPETPTVPSDSQTPVIEVQSDQVTPDSSGDTDQPSASQSQTDGITSLTFTETGEGAVAAASGERREGEPNRYQFSAEAGQVLTVVLSGEPNIGFNLFQNDEAIGIDRSDVGRREWTIPVSGTYEFRLFNGAAGSPFSFEAALSNPVADDIVTPEAPDQPVTGVIEQNDGRIQFEPGAVSATIKGTLTGDAGTPNLYVLGAGEGQIMSITLNGPENSTFVTYNSANDDSYFPGGGSNNITTGPLPAAGDYTIEVGGPAGPYELTVSIIDPTTTAPAKVVGSIQFEPGADSASIDQVFNSYAIHSYRLGVAEGQYLNASLISLRNFPMRLYKPGTNIEYKADIAQALIFTGLLSEGGEYILEIGPGHQGNWYELSLTIRNEPIVSGGGGGETGARVVSLNPWGDTQVIFNGQVSNESFFIVESFDLYAPSSVIGTPTQRIDFQTQGDIFLSDETFVAEDINFDGFTDLRLAAFRPAGSNIPFAYWLWDPASNQFVRNEAFDVLMRPEILPNNQIMSRSTLGLASSDQMLYDITAAGPVLIGWQSCEFKPQDDGSLIIENILYSVDAAGNRTIVTQKNSTEECLPYGIEGSVEWEGGSATLDEAIVLNPWGETTAVLNVESNDNSGVVINGIDLVQNGTTRQRLNIRTAGTIFYNDGSFIAEDINLDGFTDFRLVQFTPAGPNISYFYWLYDSASNSFVQNLAYDELISPEFVGDGDIKTFYRGSATLYVFGRYRVTPDGPKPVGRQVCEFIQQDDGSLVIKNTGYTVDDAGSETLVFEENSEKDCLPYKATQ